MNKMFKDIAVELFKKHVMPLTILIGFSFALSAAAFFVFARVSQPHGLFLLISSIPLHIYSAFALFLALSRAVDDPGFNMAAREAIRMVRNRNDGGDMFGN